MKLRRKSGFLAGGSGQEDTAKLDGLTVAAKLDGDRTCAACASNAGHSGVAFADSCLAMQGVICRLCAQDCAAGAIRFRFFAGGYARPEVTAELCDACGRCAEACPVRALTFG